MWFVGKRLTKRHGLKPDVRESLYDACRTWMKAVGPGRDFLGGERPNLADLAVYGGLRSFEGTAAFDDAVKNTNIGAWYSRMQKAINRL